MRSRNVTAGSCSKPAAQPSTDPTEFILPLFPNGFAPKKWERERLSKFCTGEFATMKNAIRVGIVFLFLPGAAQWCNAADKPAGPDAAKTDKTPTGYVNSELPKWMKVSGEGRERMETLNGVSFVSGTNTYLLQRLRMNLNATPRPWLTLSFQMQDARSFFTNVSPTPSTQKDPFDLRVGYVQLGSVESSTAVLRFGRQGLNFGEGRLLADPDWSNVGRSFDAARLTLHFGKLHVDAFSGMSDKINILGFSDPTPGEHFDGLYGSLDSVIPKATIEPYLLWKMEHKVKGEIVKTGNLDEKTIGVRWVGKLPLGLDYNMESAMQRGTQATEPISAWATHLVTGFTLPNVQHLPRFYTEFNRGSGDENSKDGIHNAFDILFPSSHDKFGLTDLFCWANMVHARGGFQYRARANLTLGVADNSFWLANEHDGLYSSGKILIASNGKEGRYVGQEPDAQARWNVTSRTQIDFVAGHLVAGEFLHKSGHGADFNNVVVGATQRF